MNEAGDAGMIKDNQKLFNRLHLIMDVLIVIISYAVAWFLHFEIFNDFGPEVGILPMESYMRALIVIVPAYILLYYYCNVYKPQRTSGYGREIYSIFCANTIGLVAIIVLLYIVKLNDYSRRCFSSFMC